MHTHSHTLTLTHPTCIKPGLIQMLFVHLIQLKKNKLTQIEWDRSVKMTFEDVADADKSTNIFLACERLCVCKFTKLSTCVVYMYYVSLCLCICSLICQWVYMLSFVMPHEKHRVRTLIINVSSIEYGHHGMVKVIWPDFKMMEWKKTSTNNNIVTMAGPH